MTRDELVEKLAWLSIGSESHDETEQLWDAAAMLRADGEEIERLRARLQIVNHQGTPFVDLVERLENAIEGYAKAAAEAERERDSLRARVAELEAAQRMRPMSELTGDDGEVFIWSRDRRYPFIANYRAYGALNANSEHVQAIIGWTPIPPMPSAPEDGK